MEELKVPKRQTRVDLQWPDGKTQAVAVYLAEFASSHSGAQRLSDLLNAKDEFLPAFDLDTKEVVFLARSNISVARVPSDSESSDADQHTLPQEHEVRVQLMNGRNVTGLLSYVRPPGRERVVDVLNEDTRFFSLLDREQDQLILVNKQHIARLEIISR